MLPAPPVHRILAHRAPIDMRKSFDGLVALVKEVLREDPLSSTLFVFVNRRGNVSGQSAASTPATAT